MTTADLAALVAPPPNGPAAPQNMAESVRAGLPA